MVVRLEGKIDGHNIIFQRIEGDRWETTIPRNFLGSYVVELFAVDEAGNVGYATKYILTVDTDHLHVKLLKFPFQSEIVKDNYKSVIRVSDYYCRTHISEIVSTVFVSDYYATILNDECGRSAHDDSY